MRETNFRDDFNGTDPLRDGNNGWFSLSTTIYMTQSGGFARESVTDPNLEWSNQIGGVAAIRPASLNADGWFVAGFAVQGMGPDDGAFGQGVLMVAFDPDRADDGISVVINGGGGFFDVYRHRTYLGTAETQPPTVYDNPTVDVPYLLAYQPSTGSVEVYMHNVLSGTYSTDPGLSGFSGFGLQRDGDTGDHLLVQYFVSTAPQTMSLDVSLNPAGPWVIHTEGGAPLMAHFRTLLTPLPPPPPPPPPPAT